MGKKSQRMCPVVGRTIPSQECAGARTSRHACPPHCPHNPWAPARYDEALAIEDRLQAKVIRRMAGEDPSLAGETDRFKGAFDMQDFFLKRIFLERDGQGRTFVQRWESAGWDGLNNDERVLLQAQSAMRVGVFEVQRIVDESNCLVLDRLDASAEPLVVLDRSLARQAGRFAWLVAWHYRMPHYVRMHGATVTLSEVGDLEAEEIVRAIAAHLGGPTDEPGLRAWLARNLPSLNTAVDAVAKALYARMIEQSDSRYVFTAYRYRGSMEDVAAVLRGCPDLVSTPLSDGRAHEGFDHEWTWLANAEHRDVRGTAVGRPTLGVVAMGPSGLRLESSAGPRASALRAVFEQLVGERVECVGERVDDIGRQLLDNRNHQFDPALVPPAFLEHAHRVVMAMALVSEAEVKAAKADGNTLIRRQHEAWLDEAVPALDGRTPRQAAADPVLRRRLVSLLKARIRSADRMQRTKGKGEDPSFLVRALGLSEIDVPPPPGLYDAKSSDPEEEDTRTLLPFLPRSPLTLKQIEARLTAVMQAYPEAENVLNAFDEDAPELCDWLETVTESLDDALMDIMMVTAAQAWFIFFPPGCRPGTPDVQRLSQELQTTMERIEAVAQVDDERGFNACVSSTRQPELSAMLQSMAYHMLESGTPDALEQDGGGKIVLISLVLRCLIDELDRTVREA